MSSGSEKSEKEEEKGSKESSDMKDEVGEEKPQHEVKEVVYENEILPQKKPEPKSWISLDHLSPSNKEEKAESKPN